MQFILVAKVACHSSYAYRSRWLISGSGLIQRTAPAPLKQAGEEGTNPGGAIRTVSDASGTMFPPACESKAASAGTYVANSQSRHGDPKTAEYMSAIMRHIESGWQEPYTVAWEAGAPFDAFMPRMGRQRPLIRAIHGNFL
jgi:hypothetical protein